MSPRTSQVSPTPTGANGAAQAIDEKVEAEMTRILYRSAGFGLFSNVILVMILVGMNAGAARSLASVPLSYRLYVLTTFAPLVLQFLLLPDGPGWMFVGITITYAVFLLNTAKLHHADLRQLWRLIFENETLVSTLSDAKEEAEAA